MPRQPRQRPRVLIAGAGVAGIEALLALRVLAGPHVEIDLLNPDREFVYRPVSVAEPFDYGQARHFDLGEIAEDQGARLHLGTLFAADPIRRRAVIRSGDELEFDYLVVAAGGQQVNVLPGAQRFGGPKDVSALRDTMAELESGELRSVAFALPAGVAWTLPLYELALLAGARVLASGRSGASLTLVTHEQEPLELFGAEAGRRMRALLAQRRVTLHTLSRPFRVEPGRLVLEGGGSVAADRVVALPELRGPEVVGLPHDDHGFIPTDAHGTVRGLSDVFAAGDVTTFPLKQGGIAAQQADAVAETIAARVGAPVQPAPFRPVIRGLLLTGGEPLYLRAEPGVGPPSSLAIDRPRGLGSPASAATTEALWWPPSKIAGRYLAPYLATARPQPLASAPLVDRPASAHPRAGDPGDEREDALELALILADYDARWGDYALALRSLEAAEALTGALPADYEKKRRAWLDVLEGKRSAAAQAIIH